MPVLDIKAVADSLEQEEAYRRHVYQDSKGYWTIGIGRLVDSRRRGSGLSLEESRYLLMNDIQARMDELDRRMPWWRSQTPNRQRALLEMSFQMGVDGLLNFKKMIKAMQIGHFDRAATEALDSIWARKDSPNRAMRMAELIRKG